MNDRVREVGDRIRSSMPPELTQQELALQVGMTPDALSRALNGQRGFAAFEIADIADVLDVDTYWLITGGRSPHTVTVAARHDWDPSSRERSNPGREADDHELAKVVAAYREAFPDGPPPSRVLPQDAAAAREALGGEFVRDFARRLDDVLGVDVIRIPGLSTDYSMTIGRRSLIVLTSTTNWFRNNWSAAHELGHLILGHHENGDPTRDEAAANMFAAELLLPAESVRSVDWATPGITALADRLWRWGVSTRALGHRLDTLRIRVDGPTRALLEATTLQVLRRGLAELTEDPFLIARRETASRGRLFPEALVATLIERVADGVAAPQTLAWVQDVPVGDLDFPEPDIDSMHTTYPSAVTAPTDFDTVRRYVDSIAHKADG